MRRLAGHRSRGILGIRGRGLREMALAVVALACAYGACWYGDPRARPPDASAATPGADGGEEAEPRDAAPEDCARLDACASSDAGDAGDACAHAAAAEWARIITNTPPPGRSSARLAFDPSDQSLVLFGGDVGSGAETTLTSETLRLTGNIWAALDPPRRPSARMDHAMTTGEGSVFLFGGQGASELSAELWEWTGTTWKELCTNVECRATRPSARATAGLAYDTERRRLVLIGGRGERGPADDTWEWDGAAWTRVCGGPLPSCGFVASDALFGGAIYDPVRRRTVFLHEHVPSLTYEYDGAGWARVWSVAAPPFPGGTFGHVAGSAYDPLRRVMVSLGHSAAGDLRAWEWNGVCWWDTTSQPLAFDVHQSAIAYDVKNARLVRVGGRSLTVSGAFEREAFERPSR